MDPVSSKGAPVNTPRMDPPRGDLEQRPSTPLAVPIKDLGNSEATGVLTTKEQRTLSQTRQSLESYVPSLARAREAWNVVTEKIANFDAAFRVSNYLVIYPVLPCCCITLYE